MTTIRQTAWGCQCEIEVNVDTVSGEVEDVDIRDACIEHTRPDLDYLISMIESMRKEEPEIHPDEAGSNDHYLKYAEWVVLEDTIHDVIMLVKEAFG